MFPCRRSARFYCLRRAHASPSGRYLPGAAGLAGRQLARQWQASAGRAFGVRERPADGRVRWRRPAPVGAVPRSRARSECSSAPAQRLPRTVRQRVREHPLRLPVRYPLAMRPRAAPRLARFDPVQRPAARPLEVQRIHERLRHQRRTTQRRFHARRQPTQRQRQNARRQVRRLRPRRNQKARVVRHQPQPPQPRLRRPADPGVPRLLLESPIWLLAAGCWLQGQ